MIRKSESKFTLCKPCGSRHCAQPIDRLGDSEESSKSSQFSSDGNIVAIPTRDFLHKIPASPSAIIISHFRPAVAVARCGYSATSKFA